MIWTLEQVRQAQGIRVRGWLDIALMARHEPAAEVLCRKLAREGVEIGHDFGLELHEGDFAFDRQDDDEQPWRLARFDAAWRPSTNRVELRGGHMDGQFYSLRQPGEPLRVPAPRTSPLLDEGNHHPEAVTSTATTYQLVGWHETERHWVYEAR